MVGDVGQRNIGGSDPWKFFLGVLLGIGVGVPLTMISLFYLADRVTAIVVGMLIALIALAICISLLVLFRDKIISKAFHGAAGSFNNLVTAAVETLEHTSKSQPAAATTAAAIAVREAAALYVWGRVRWRMLTWFLSLLAAIAVYIQGMLLFQQNSILNSQSSIMNKQVDLSVKQNELADTQNALVGAQNAVAEQQRVLLSRQTEIQESQSRVERLSVRSSLADQSMQMLRDVWSDLNAIIVNSLNGMPSIRPEDETKLYETLSETLDPIPWDALEAGLAGTDNEAFDRSYRVLSERDMRLVEQIRLKSLLEDQLRPPSDAQFTQSHQSNRPTPLPDYGFAPTLRVSDRRYRFITAFFDILGGSVDEDVLIYQEAKADFLLSLIRMDLDTTPFAQGGANLQFCRFVDREIRDLNFVYFDLQHAVFQNVKFIRVNMENCDLRDCTFERCEFSDCSFERSKLPSSESFRKVRVDHPSTFNGAYVKEQEWPEAVGDTILVRLP